MRGAWTLVKPASNGQVYPLLILLEPHKIGTVLGGRAREIHLETAPRREQQADELVDGKIFESWTALHQFAEIRGWQS